jgi:hypothetical protein
MGRQNSKERDDIVSPIGKPDAKKKKKQQPSGRPPNSGGETHKDSWKFRVQLPTIVGEIDRNRIMGCSCCRKSCVAVAVLETTYNLLGDCVVMRECLSRMDNRGRRTWLRNYFDQNVNLVKDQKHLKVGLPSSFVFYSSQTHRRPPGSCRAGRRCA